MFKSFFASAAVLVLIACPASAADVALKTFATIDQKGSTNLNQVAFISTPVAGPLGAFAYTVTAQKWAEAIGGITYTTDCSQLLVGVGAEQDSHPFRGYTGIWLGNKDVSLLAEVEFGGSGWWYQSIGTWKMNDRFSLGYTIRRFEGIGPRLEVTIPKTPVTLWGGIYVYEPESGKLLPGSIIGITTHF